MVYEYKRVFGKSNPISASSKMQAYDEEKMFKMHNVTDDILDGTFENEEKKCWSELPHDAKVRKIINYTNKQYEIEAISKIQSTMLRSELISLLSKRKLNKDIHVNYDAENKCIIGVPCVEYDNIIECYVFVEEKETSSIKKIILEKNISKI
tara:strand:- start:34 stop:489 length:456 start_codon:yes stop_codon:yes gene_type:complete